MEMKGINHVNIAVSDLDKSQKFYCEVFGMEEGKERKIQASSSAVY